MIKTNSTKIEWTNRVWNPITGCLHNCWYCYAKKLFTRFHKSFKPTFYPERLEELKKLKKPAKVFVCSVSDLFALWTKPEWRDAVLKEIQKPEYNHLTFQLLTKNPENIKLEPKENIWVGATITQYKDLDKIWELTTHYKGHKFLSFEPLLELVSPHTLEGIEWIIIGKLTGSKKIKLNLDWVKYLIGRARELKIPIFLKNNLKWPIKIQEFPIIKNGEKRT